MNGYVFVTNGNKKNEYSKNDKVKLGSFSKPCIKAAINLRFTVYYGVNYPEVEMLKTEDPINLYNANIYRNIFNVKDIIIAFKNLKNLIKSKNISVIHCNTPIGGLVGRLVGKLYNVQKVIYTVHGFHFYEGASLYKNIIYKSAEKLMARWTDAIITINHEDYEAAKKFKLKKNGKVFKTHGVGIDIDKLDKIDIKKSEKRSSLNLNMQDFIIISAGRLDAGKNYESSIRAIAELKDLNNVHYLICGEGPEEQKLKKLVKKLDVCNNVHFLGYRTDMIELMKISDVLLFTSYREGLPRATMEAMACGLPCVVSDIRGNRDLIINEKGGFLCPPDDFKLISEKLKYIYNNEKIRHIMKEYNMNYIKKYDISVVEQEIQQIYKEVL